MILSDQPCCLQCASTLPVPGVDRCGKCIITPPAFDTTITLLGYDEQAQFLLKQFKYYGKLSISDWLLPHLIQTIHHHPMRHHLPLPQALIPVPLHRWRLLKRGFNQSTLIARQLSRAFHIPLYANLFTRNRSTTQQSKLAFQFRQKNIKGAFSIKAQTTPLFFSENKIEHVAIVDDVMTTGATAQALAKLLKQECKVQHVEVWTLMRAL